MASLTFQGGWFHRILGKAVRSREFTFIPVLGDLGDSNIVPYCREGEGFCIPLSKWVKGKLPRKIREGSDGLETPLELVDAVWVRGRIPAIFGQNFVFSGSLLDYKYRLIELMFVACELKLKEEWIAYPFICEDCELCTQLRFNINEASREVYERIARDFSQLLLRDVERVDNFYDCYLRENEFGDEAWYSIALKERRFQIEWLGNLDF